ncbi:Co/Ni ABC transporter CbiKLMQO, membrane protein CbiL [Campylobacter pinnipediorum subsp. caledonicus]|uniref:Co/Ni ABC transporter CbiKLMQO, membrane protein CbiL n=1 Tax=Campylobacter pinnipediorum subsp. caledonicus TaxID=1874362 RepID=A0A1S6U5E1_9BACT|nr:hypothetical protein [Campylobacter pinnipediorum]AQW86944.1 Co/Ni ABC transporter CbiKLMQO, membrane protein CbiL [Campylobacter pinnipediorum subsp. caledonicus]
MKFFVTLAFICSFLFSHGLFYEAKEGKAIIINANFTKSVPAAYAKIEIFEGDSALAFVNSRMDSKGNFAFLPQSAGTYNVKITAGSDHGEHIKEFKIDVANDFEIAKFEQPVFQKYFGALSAIGIIFGIFGVLSLIKSRKKDN